MTEMAGVVFVVDDDASMRESLKNLTRSVGLRVEAFASAQSSCERNGRMNQAAWCSTCECRA